MKSKGRREDRAGRRREAGEERTGAARQRGRDGSGAPRAMRLLATALALLATASAPGKRHRPCPARRHRPSPARSDPGPLRPQPAPTPAPLGQPRPAPRSGAGPGPGAGVGPGPRAGPGWGRAGLGHILLRGSPPPCPAPPGSRQPRSFAAIASPLEKKALSMPVHGNGSAAVFCARQSRSKGRLGIVFSTGDPLGIWWKKRPPFKSFMPPKTKVCVGQHCVS